MANVQWVAKSDNPIWLICPKRHLSNFREPAYFLGLGNFQWWTKRPDWLYPECLCQSSLAVRLDYECLQIWNINRHVLQSSQSHIFLLLFIKADLLKIFFACLFCGGQWLFFEPDNLICLLLSVTFFSGKAIFLPFLILDSKDKTDWNNKRKVQRDLYCHFFFEKSEAENRPFQYLISDQQVNLKKSAPYN